MKSKSLFRQLGIFFLLIVTLSGNSCDGDDGDDGATGDAGPVGETGPQGPQGPAAGSTTSTADYAKNVHIMLTPENINLIASAPFQANFNLAVENVLGEMVPLTGVKTIRFNVVSQVMNNSGSGSPYNWLNHVTANEAGTSMRCNASGLSDDGDEYCTITESETEPGYYSAMWSHEGSAPVILADGDPTNLHRVLIRVDGLKMSNGESLSDRVYSAPLDFIPDTNALATSMKDTVGNETCIKCHSDGALDGGFHKVGHNNQYVENCVVCHNADRNPSRDGSFNADFGPMIHTVHAGHDVDDVLTGDALADFGEIAFPASLSECTNCHMDNDAWQTNLYASACQGCHLDVNLETGEGHEGGPQEDETCIVCHGESSFVAVSEMHNVGDRAAATASVELTVSNVDYEEDAVDNEGDTLDRISVTVDVMINGAPAADGFDFADYITPPGGVWWGNQGDLLVGTVDDNGINYQVEWFTYKGFPASDGKITAVYEADLNLEGESIYITSLTAFCATDGMIAKCDDAKQTNVSATTEATYWNLANTDGSGANVARWSQPDRVTVDIEKCAGCHESTSLMPWHDLYGAEDFDQCMHCHGNGFGGSFHHEVKYKKVDADGNLVYDEEGNEILVTQEGLIYNSRDLFSEVHRSHSGLWDYFKDGSGKVGMYRDTNGVMHNFPGRQNNCMACHKDGMNLFAEDGGLTSGKRAIKLETDSNYYWDNDRLLWDMVSPAEGYATPVAEACRTCHQHSDQATRAHMISNGAVLGPQISVFQNEDDSSMEDAWAAEAGGSPDMPVESCGVCHAEGKTYGIDKVHDMK